MEERSLFGPSDLRGDDGPPMDEKRALPPELPIRPLLFEEDDDEATLDQSQTFMSAVLHVCVAGNDDLAAIIRKSPQPWDIVFGTVIGITRFWGVFLCCSDFEIARYFSKLVLAGESLQDPHHADGNILVKNNFQAALARCSSNLTASLTWRSAMSKISATNCALPSTLTALAIVAVGILLRFKTG